MTRRVLPFVALETSTVLAGTANGITMVAFPWLVLQETGDATAAGTIAAVAALPLLLSMLFTGTLVDVVGRRRVSIISDLLSMASVALVPVLAATVGLDVGLLLLVAVLGAVFDPAGITARESMLPEAAGRAGLGLERANGVHEAAYGLAFLLGPGIGGLLIGLVGATSTFWATAVAFALSAVLMLCVRVPGGGRPAAHQRPQGFWRSTRDGFAFLWRDRVLRSVAILSAVLIGLWLPIEAVVLPVYFTEISSPERLGLLVTVMSGGGVIGALAYAAVATRMRRRTAFTVALVGTSLPLIGLALLPSYPAMLALGFLTGLFFGPVNPIANTAMQLRTPSRLRGRVVGAMSSAAYAAGPIGFLVAGPLIQSLGVQASFLILAGALTVLTVGAAFMPALAGLDDAPVEPLDTVVDLRQAEPDVRLHEAQELVRSVSSGEGHPVAAASPAAPPPQDDGT